MSDKPTDVGGNRTGIKLSPIDARKTAQGAIDDTPERSFAAGSADAWRKEIMGGADPVGTMPLPGTLKGAARTLLKAVQGKDANVFIDLVGQRLAFERSGVRLYEALLLKFDAASIHGAIAREDMEQIRDEELEHFGLLVETMEKLGADPTAVTPSADVAGVASSGLVKVLADPRTTFTECLDAILTAELVDNDAWLVLADMADRLGLDEIAVRFRKALQQEEQHLARARHWRITRLEGQAGLDPRPSAPTPSPPPA